MSLEVQPLLERALWIVGRRSSLSSWAEHLSSLAVENMAGRQTRKPLLAGLPRRPAVGTLRLAAGSSALPPFE